MLFTNSLIHFCKNILKLACIRFFLLKKITTSRKQVTVVKNTILHIVKNKPRLNDVAFF